LPNNIEFQINVLVGLFTFRYVGEKIELGNFLCV
jgi:hypothetical protein